MMDQPKEIRGHVTYGEGVKEAEKRSLDKIGGLVDKDIPHASALIFVYKLEDGTFAGEVPHGCNARGFEAIEYLENLKASLVVVMRKIDERIAEIERVRTVIMLRGPKSVPIAEA